MHGDRLPDPLDVRRSHSEMFPYAIRLAKEFGCTEVFIEPDITGDSSHRPDVVGILGDGRYFIVECEYSTGEKFRPNGPKDRLAKDTQLKQKAIIHFILRGPAKTMKKWILEHFGSDVVIHDFDELHRKYGKLTI